MEGSTKRKIIAIEDTRFIFRTNFAGDPDMDKYGSSERKANLIIPTMEQANDLLLDGFNVKARTCDPAVAEELTGLGFAVKLTDPKPGHEADEPVFYVIVKAKYDSYYPPKIYLVNESGRPIELDEDTVSRIDRVRVANVKAILTPYRRDQNVNKKTLYIKTMYVEQDMDDDPYAAQYANQEVEDEDHPF